MYVQKLHMTQGKSKKRLLGVLQSDPCFLTMQGQRARDIL